MSCNKLYHGIKLKLFGTTKKICIKREVYASGKVYLFSLVIILSGFNSIYGQGSSSASNNTGVEFTPYYESWSIKGGSSFSELTNILNVNYSPVSNTRLGFTTRYAALSGDVNHLSGFSDSQILIGQEIPGYNLVLNGGVNIPSGVTKLSQNEFLATKLVSQNLFMLKTPNFGQGLNLFIGGTWAHPVMDNFVLGIGISYQVKNEYQPLKDTTLKYKPSNEICGTGGFDIRLGKSSTLTGDITGIFYWSDKLGGQYVFKTGNRIIFDMIFKHYFGYNVLTGTLIYRNVAIDELKGNAAFVENEKLNPNQVYFSIGFNQRLSEIVTLGYGVYASVYEKSAASFSGYSIYGVNITPQFKVSQNVIIPVFLQFGMGNASGKPDLQNFIVATGIKIGI